MTPVRAREVVLGAMVSVADPVPVAFGLPIVIQSEVVTAVHWQAVSTFRTRMPPSGPMPDPAERVRVVLQEFAALFWDWLTPMISSRFHSSGRSI